MGWSGGSLLMSEVIAAIHNHVDDEDIRKEIYLEIIDAFEDKDADTLDECCDEDIAFEEAYSDLHPEYREDYE